LTRKPSARALHAIRLIQTAGQPLGLFRPIPSSFKGYDKDHTKLLVDYILQLTPEEQRRVGAAMGRSQGAGGGPDRLCL